VGEICICCVVTVHHKQGCFPRMKKWYLEGVGDRNYIWGRKFWLDSLEMVSVKDCKVTYRLLRIAHTSDKESRNHQTWTFEFFGPWKI
jgi:hypothetical protein